MFGMVVAVTLIVLVFEFLVDVMYTCYYMFAVFCLVFSVADCLFLVDVCLAWLVWVYGLGVLRLFLFLFVDLVFVVLLDCAWVLGYLRFGWICFGLVVVVSFWIRWFMDFGVLFWGWAVP